jgi:hypothetical protein
LRRYGVPIRLQELGLRSRNSEKYCHSTVGHLDAHQSNLTCLRQVDGAMNGACGVAVIAIKPNGSEFPFSPRTDVPGYFQVVPSGLDIKAG